MINHAAVVVSQEKSVATVIKNARRATVDLSHVEKPGNEVLHGSGFRNSYNFITPPQALFCRSMQRNQKRSVEIFQTEWRAVRRKGCQRIWHLGTVKLSADIVFGIRIDPRACLETVRPTVVLAALNRVKRVVGTIVAEVI